MTENRFFRGHKRRGSFDLFSSYDHFVPGWSGVMMLVFMFGLGIGLGALLQLTLTTFAGNALMAKYGMLITYPVMFIPALIYASAASRAKEHLVPAVPVDQKLQTNDRKTSATVIFACIFSTIAAAYILEAVTMLLPEMPESVKAQLELLMKGMPTWVAFITVAIYAPLFEEWLCRGLVLRGLLQKTSPAVAFIVSAVFFAVIHGNLWQAVPAFGMGLLFAYVYYRTGSLKLTMLMHFVNNCLALFMSKIPQFEDAESFMDILSPWAYWCIFAACLVILPSSIILIKSSTTRSQSVN